MLLAQRRLEMSCAVCVRDTAKRAEWGCDGKTSWPVYTLRCVRCRGRDTSCALCRGTGEVDQFTCPNLQLEGRGDIVEALWAYRAFRKHGILPCAGGLFDQAAQFLEMAHYVDALLAELEAQDEHDAKEKMRRARRQSTARGRAQAPR